MKTANKFQMEYMQAKALVMVINALCDEKEQEYISSHKIVNRDGSTPSHIWALDSDSAFEKTRLLHNRGEQSPRIYSDLKYAYLSYAFITHCPAVFFCTKRRSINE